MVGVVQAEMSLGTERSRLYFADVPHINMFRILTERMSGAVPVPAKLARRRVGVARR